MYAPFYFPIHFIINTFKNKNNTRIYIQNNLDLIHSTNQ